MRKTPRARHLPIIMLPAPRNMRLRDAVLGGAMGVFMGRALAGLIWMLNGKDPSSTGRRSRQMPAYQA